MMIDKKLHFDKNQKTKSPSLQTVRQQLRNKLIEVGLSCSQPKEPSSHNIRPIKKRNNHYNHSKNLPLILSLQNSVAIGKDSSSRFDPNFQEIFSHRDIFIQNQALSGSKIVQPHTKSSEKPSTNSFREHFQKKMTEEIKRYKIQQNLPKIRQSLRKQNLKTEADQTIVIRALKAVEQDSQETIKTSPKAKIKINRSKTEEKKPNEAKKVKKVQIKQQRRLTPWGESNEIGLWLQQY